MSLEFFGGVDEIGGNKILVKNDSSSFFDFGMSFSQNNQYFSEFLTPRTANGVNDFVEMGLLPLIKGIYREDYLRHCGINCQDRPSVDGVLISHAHMDNAAYVHFLREDIPIFLTDESLLMFQAIQDTGKASFNDLIYLKNAFQLNKKKNKPREGTSPYTRRSSERIARDITVVKPYDEFSIGEFTASCLPVDHSLPGACGYQLDTGEEAILYTGDLRFH
jgi:ribonuclease J